MTFEAAWSASGAVRVAHTRIPELATVEILRTYCADKVARSPTECTEGAAFRTSDALIGNRSFAK